MQKILDSFKTHCLISLRHDALVPNEITSVLGIQPTRSIKIGQTDRFINTSGEIVEYIASTGIWQYATYNIARARRPETHLSRLLSLFYPKRREWKQLIDRGYHQACWLSHYRTEGELGYTLTHKHLRMLADLQVSLSLSTNTIKARD